MRKYKLEREYIFSNKTGKQIRKFLQDSQQTLDLLNLVDDEKHTAIHHCAYHNHFTQLKIYVDYVEKNNKSQHIQNQIQQWVNKRNKDGLTPILYAAYKGNIQILDYLRKKGGDVKAITQNQVNALHLAAQTDKVQTFVYYRGILDINSIDNKKSTALHWSSYMGSNKVVSYLLAQGQVDINAVDKQSQTALHLATAYGNTQIVKKLLVKGADRQMKNKKKETALKIARLSQFKRIQRMLDNSYNCVDRLKLYYNKRMKYQPQQRKINKPITFIIMFILFLGLNNLLFKFDQGMQYMLYFECALIFILLASFVSLLPATPSITKIQQDYSEYLYQQGQLNRICFDCNGYKPNRSLHCYICKTCVQLYDHHCPWINNCVGKHNLKRYYTFVLSLFIHLMYLMVFGVFIILREYDEYSIVYIRFEDVSLRGVEIVLGLVNIVVMGLILGFMILLLLIRQTKNLCLNKTTYERFTKDVRSTFTQSQSFIISKNKKDEVNKPSFRNCISMCCFSESVDNKESKTTDSLLNDHS